MNGQLRRFQLFSRVFRGFLGAAVLAAPALAQDTGPGPSLEIQLNTISEIEGGCRMIFVAENNLSADIDTLVLEAVLFTVEGGVERLTLMNFQGVPRGRPRVRQFDFLGPACSDLGQVLINGIQSCTGDGFETSNCDEGLSIESRTDLEVLG
jgi:hypothetical protein